MAKVVVCTIGVLLFFTVSIIHAQTNPQQIFVTPTDEGDTVSFIDILTGAATETTVNGERYTVVGENVVFYDLDNSRVGLITPEGDVQPHPFIEVTPATHRVNWVVSGDHRLIAWTLTNIDENGMLTTVTTVANLDGSNLQVVLTDGPRNGIRAMPVAFSVDDNYLYMDYQPDGIGDFTPYDEYAGLFEVSLKQGYAVNNLPGEPDCYCGAGFGGGYFVRLAIADDFSGFNLRVVDLAAQLDYTLEPLPLQNYTQGGDVLVSPDGTRAVYALAQVQDFGSPAQTVRTIFVLVDLVEETQRQLTQPQTLYVRPVAWTENNDAIIFTSPTRNGTWKMNIDDGLLQQLSNSNYIGVTHN